MASPEDSEPRVESSDPQCEDTEEIGLIPGHVREFEPPLYNPEVCRAVARPHGVCHSCGILRPAFNLPDPQVLNRAVGAATCLEGFSQLDHISCSCHCYQCSHADHVGHSWRQVEHLPHFIRHYQGF